LGRVFLIGLLIWLVLSGAISASGLPKITPKSEKSIG
jgi:hypothetical protein